MTLLPPLPAAPVEPPLPVLVEPPLPEPVEPPLPVVVDPPAPVEPPPPVPSLFDDAQAAATAKETAKE
jgi:hypothetical protein